MSAHKRRRILVPIDFSDGAQHATDFAIGLARELDAEIVLLHVFEVPSVPMLDGSVVLAPPDVHAALVQAVAIKLSDATSRAKNHYPHVSSRTEQGRPAETILSVLGDKGWYMAVLGTHGRSGVLRLLLGSVAERVVRGTDVPVLLVRHPDPPIHLPDVPII